MYLIPLTNKYETNFISIALFEILLVYNFREEWITISTKQVTVWEVGICVRSLKTSSSKPILYLHVKTSLSFSALICYQAILTLKVTVISSQWLCVCVCGFFFDSKYLLYLLTFSAQTRAAETRTQDTGKLILFKKLFKTSALYQAVRSSFDQPPHIVYQSTGVIIKFCVWFKYHVKMFWGCCFFFFNSLWIIPTARAAVFFSIEKCH